MLGNGSRLVAWIALSTILTAILVCAAGSAQAAAYRYWSYWQGASGQWVAAQTGPGDHVVTDADVQGWRFGITSDAPSTPPDNDPDFAALCPALAATPAAHAMVRVAVVIDGGPTAAAPKGEAPPADQIACVTVPAGSTGNQALAAAASVRSEGSLVCAVNGYPATECGAEVTDDVAAAAASAAASEKPNPAAPAGPTSDKVDQAALAGNSPSVPAIVAALIAAIGVAGAAVFIGRRRAR
jgi:hypothetical protein